MTTNETKTTGKVYQEVCWLQRLVMWQ
jgi:hypothetical protein